MRTIKTSDTKVTTTPRIPESEIAELAYTLWQERGCPDGSPTEDWFRAEDILQVQSATAVN